MFSISKFLFYKVKVSIGGIADLANDNWDFLLERDAGLHQLILTSDAKPFNVARIGPNLQYACICEIGYYF